MPAKDEQLQAVRDHSDFIRHRLDPRETVDRPWIITAMFYVALHAVEAYFAAAGTHRGHHAQRNTAIANDSSLAAVWPDYRFLYDRSRDARYSLIPFSQLDIQTMQVQRLDAICCHVLPLVAP